MAIKSTIFKANLQIADMDRFYYADHPLTLARHPSETDERMMVRLLAFALYANEALIFAQSITGEDEPDLWQKDLTGAIERWINVGLPDERILRKACGRAAHVVVLTYGRTADVWWNQNRSKLQRLNNLTVLNLPVETSLALAQLANRNMQLQYTRQEGDLMMTSDAGMTELTVEAWQGKPV